ncbi:hypothetical protein [Neoroseomonas soli]|uniref:Uncharacterized protein n=1 Tax=Neoroseomonas soli TaxID=1081025 RepID=A0A9X9WWF7_9PROT|nr:hypothetical protein [Neoroseomonas soli]MBR0671486.1 hypothetical protein [Neoroseomonas soli]
MLGQILKVTAVLAAFAAAGEILLAPPLSCWAANVLVQRDSGSPDTAQLVLFSPGGGVGMMLRRFAERPPDQPGSNCRATLRRAVTPR